MKNIFLLSLFLILSIISLRCNRDEIVDPLPPVTPSVTNGIYFLCEGNMTPGTSSLSFYNNDNDSLYSDIFTPSRLGLFPDGLIQVGKYLYITEQGNFNSTGKIYQCDTTGKVLNVGNSGINPYSLSSSNNKLYITNGPSGSVSVIENNSLNLIKNLPVGVYPQEIISFKNKVYVCNTSVYGGAADSTVSVIDASVDSVIFIINLQKDPSSMAISNNGKLLAGCPGNGGIIYVINTDNYSIENTFTNINIAKDISVDKNSDNIYYISNTNNINKLNLSSGAVNIFINNANTLSDFYYGYIFDSKAKKHYIADAKNFITSGALMKYDINGVIEKTLSTGISPRRMFVRIN